MTGLKQHKFAYSGVIPKPLLTHDPLRLRFRVCFKQHKLTSHFCMMIHYSSNKFIQTSYLSIGRVTHFGAMLCNNCPADVNKLLSMPCKPDRDRSRKICIAPWTSSSSGYIVLHPVMSLHMGCVRHSVDAHNFIMLKQLLHRQDQQLKWNDSTSSIQFS